MRKWPMACHLALFVAIIAVALLVPRTAGEPWPVCGDDFGTFTPQSRYYANLMRINATLPSNASASPDLSATAVDVGAVPEQVSALALCRGDVGASSCLSCLTQAFANLANLCGNTKAATIYYDRCTLSYSSVHFLSDGDDPRQIPAYTVNNHAGNVTSEPDRYNRLVAALVNATADYAAYNSTRRFASGEADFNRQFPKVYSMAQCTPDLSPARCRSCLAKIVSQEIWTYKDTIGGRTMAVRCAFRVETARFLNGTTLVRLPGPSGSPAPAPAANVTPPAVAASGLETKYKVPRLVLVILLPILAAINLVVCFCVWRRRRPATKAKQTNAKYYAEAEDVDSADSMLMDISILRAATGDFAESNKLGEGGFGAVYKGVLPDGSEIAVKRLSKSSTQGVEALKNELALVAKLRHKNLVTLVGVCLEEHEKLLVYEFVPNRSLDLILLDTEKREKLEWEKRYKIINGMARGLQYLHEDSQLKVVHRDLKTSNILLDANMNPKISDFGLARIFGRDQTQAVTNRVVGTYGYMAPEYMMRGNYSVKSDAFSFGVMVLEIVTGRKNNDLYSSPQSLDLLTTIIA
ncbi:cysteine-rich receptor-like protein kinase 6 isoform X2 [Oryza brachyantha]|uniref:cysteine-rich receptor-like protein kinase 6 isoform X2 n=1 Tax=Oryza brachyantha TaxID=4533 RepID=UPI001ADB27A8|nr:cysteine-rich receptor-like protein kinase 6 isoform X2 [Oryza brachyantha]